MYKRQEKEKAPVPVKRPKISPTPSPTAAGQLEVKASESSEDEQIQIGAKRIFARPSFFVDLTPDDDSDEEKILRLVEKGVDVNDARTEVVRNRWNKVPIKPEETLMLTSEAQAEAAANALGELGIKEWPQWKKTARGKTRTTAALVIKKFRQHDLKASKKFGYANYEERFAKDAWFRSSMLDLGFGPDMREEIRQVWSKQTGKAFGKGALAAKARARAAAKGEDKGQGKGKGKQRSKPSSKPTLTHYIQQGRNAAGWTAAATWASSASGADGSAVVPYGSNQVATQDGNPGIPYMFYFKIMTGMLIVLIAIYIYWKARQCVRRLSRVLSAPAETERFRYRSVGVQSQVTYTGERFKAYENGFRRAGEISIELHEYFEKKNN